MFPKLEKRSGSISSIKSGNEISSCSELGIAVVNGISGKEFASAT
jgi:hypothetical protein